MSRLLLLTVALLHRWNGYNADSHAQVMQRFEALEGQRREERQKAIEEKLSTGAGLVSAAAPCRSLPHSLAAGVVPEGLDDDEEKDNIGDNTIGQHFDAKNRQSVRNLRIREDTAKFLFNLDPNSAHYDPRTRAMRANPLQGEVWVPSLLVCFCVFAGLTRVRTHNKPNLRVIISFATLATSSSLQRASFTRSLLKISAATST